MDPSLNEHCAVCASVSGLRARREYVEEYDIEENNQERLERMGLSRCGAHRKYRGGCVQYFKYARMKEIPIRFWYTMSGDSLFESSADGATTGAELLIRVQSHLKQVTGKFVPSRHIALSPKGVAYDPEEVQESRWVAQGFVDFDVYLRFPCPINPTSHVTKSI